MAQTPAADPMPDHRRASSLRMRLWNWGMHYVRKADSRIPFRNRVLRGMCMCVLLFPWSLVLMLAGAQWNAMHARHHRVTYDPQCFAWRETSFCHPFG